MARRVAQIRREFASDLIDLHAVKIPNDGTIEGETAAVLTPYAAGGSGAVLLSGEPFSQFLFRTAKSQFDAHIHAMATARCA